MFQKRSVWKVQKEVGFGEPLKHCDEDVMFNKAVNLHLVDPFVKAEDLSKVVLVVVTKKVPIQLWITNCFLLILPNGKALFCSCISPLESNSHKNEKRKRNVELHCLQSSEYFMKTCSKVFKSQRLFLYICCTYRIDTTHISSIRTKRLPAAAPTSKDQNEDTENPHAAIDNKLLSRFLWLFVYTKMRFLAFNFTLFSSYGWQGPKGATSSIEWKLG